MFELTQNNSKSVENIVSALQAFYEADNEEDMIEILAELYRTGYNHAMQNVGKDGLHLAEQDWAKYLKISAKGQLHLSGGI